MKSLALAVALSAGAIFQSPAQTAPALLPPPEATQAEVVIVQNANAIDTYQPRPAEVSRMTDRGVMKLTGKSTVKDAWLSLVSTQDIVGIKVYSEPGPNSGTRPAVVSAVINGLISSGVPRDRIIIWDRRQVDLRLAGYFELARKLGVRAAGSSDGGYDDNTFYETTLIGNLVWGDHEFGRKGEGVGRRSFVSKLVTSEMTKIINITPLVNHNQAGVCGNLFSLAFGSIDNSTRFLASSERIATAVPEVYNLPVLYDRVVLNIVDALICQYEGEERSFLHYSAILNQIRLSRDPVALDVLSLQELERQRELSKAPSMKINRELYENASLLEIGVSDLKRIRVTTIE